MSNFIPDNSAPPPGWEREVPKYRVVRDVHPSANSRFKFENPFAQILDADEYQYGTRIIKAGEIVETTAWPHPSWRALNYSAQKVLSFFNGAMRSRLTRSPWHNGAVRLDNGLSDAPAIFDVRPPKVQPFNVRPQPDRAA